MDSVVTMEKETEDNGREKTESITALEARKTDNEKRKGVYVMVHHGTWAFIVNTVY